MKKVLALSVCTAMLTSPFLGNQVSAEQIDSIKEVQQEGEILKDSKVLTEEVASNLTPDDFVYVYHVLTSQENFDSLTEEEMNDLVVTELNNIYDKKLNDGDIQLFSGLPTDKYKINKAEAILAAANPVVATFVYGTAEKATTRVAELFTSPNADHHNGNAFKHAYWNALMTGHLLIGETWAKKWGDAHEEASTDPLATEMDLFNNAVGRQVYKDVAKDKILLPSDSDLSNEILKRIKDGKLKRIVNRKLVATDGTGRK